MTAKETNHMSWQTNPHGLNKNKQTNPRGLIKNRKINPWSTSAEGYTMNDAYLFKES